MDLDPRRLRVLRALAVRGGVADAAELLHLTPSAVSQHLAQLEREVGQPLVDRSGRKAGLTPAGHLLAARAERIEQELAEAARELAEFTGRVSGPVKVAAFSTAVTNLVLSALRRLARAHPALDPQITELEGSAALHELRTGGVDLVIAEYDRGDSSAVPQRKDISAVPLADDEYCIVVPARWSPRPHAIKDLAARPWIAGPTGSACGNALDRIASQHSFTARRAHTAREFPTVLSLVSAGLGAAVVPHLALGEPVADTLALLAAPPAGHRRIAAIWRTSRSGPEPRTDALIRALQEAAVGLGLTPVSGGRR